MSVLFYNDILSYAVTVGFDNIGVTSDGAVGFFASTLPSNPAAARIAQRIALTPKGVLVLSTRTSALQVRISPNAPGPSNRPSGWTMGLKF